MSEEAPEILLKLLSTLVKTSVKGCVYPCVCLEPYLCSLDTDF